jgi:hypothetical protein
MKRDPNTMRVSVLIPLVIIALLAGAGIYIGGGKGVPVTAGTIYAAESTYAIALEGAVTYRHLCVGYDDGAGHHAPVLASNCRTTLTAIQAANKRAEAAYQVVKGYEANPPGNAAQDFIAAVSLFKAAIPAQ